MKLVRDIHSRSRLGVTVEIEKIGRLTNPVAYEGRA
jgi:hypothetical protein